MVKERSIDGGAGRCVSLRRGILRSDPARGLLAGVARTSGVARGKAPGFTVTGRAWAAAGRS